jgi:hypothetical protein
MPGSDAGRALTVVLLLYIAMLIAGLGGVTVTASPASSTAVTPLSTPPTVDDVLLPTAGS